MSLIGGLRFEGVSVCDPHGVGFSGMTGGIISVLARENPSNFFLEMEKLSCLPPQNGG